MFKIIADARRFVSATVVLALLATSLAGCQMQVSQGTSAAAAQRVTKVTEVALAADVQLYTERSVQGCRVTTNNVVIGRNLDGSVKEVAMTSDIRATQGCAGLGEVVRNVPGVASTLLTLQTLNAMNGK